MPGLELRQGDVVEADVVDVEGDVLLGLPLDRLGELFRLDMAGSSIFLMMTECPETEVAKLAVLTPLCSFNFWMASTTRDESMIEPSTIASGDRGSTPMRCSWYCPPFFSFSSTSFTVALPMSRPTTPLEREKNTDECLSGGSARLRCRARKDCIDADLPRFLQALTERSSGPGPLSRSLICFWL